jgi:hypothetical protein
MDIDFKTSLDENVIWHGKPEFKPYILLGLLRFASATKFLAFIWLLMLVSNMIGYGPNWGAMFMFAFLIVSIELFMLGRRYFNYNSTHYFITNKRVIIRNAAHCTKSLDRNLIIKLDIAASGVERKYCTGSILIDIGEVRNNDGQDQKVLYKLEAISDPEQVLRIL